MEAGWRLSVIIFILVASLLVYEIRASFQELKKTQIENNFWRRNLKKGDTVKMSLGVYGVIDSVNNDSVKININTKKEFILKP